MAALAACFGLVPIAVQLSAPAASAATTSCSATGSGTALSRTGWVASAFQSSADVPANAIDGNLTTRWSSGTAQAVGNWFQVNMGSAQNFDEVDMEVPNSAGDYARGYSVEVSNDGTTFATIESCTGSGSSEIATFALQTAQYVRIVLTAATSPNWWSIDELYAYNTGTGSTSTTAATTTTTAGTTTTTKATTTTAAIALAIATLPRRPPPHCLTCAGDGEGQLFGTEGDPGTAVSFFCFFCDAQVVRPSRGPGKERT